MPFEMKRHAIRRSMAALAVVGFAAVWLAGPAAAEDLGPSVDANLQAGLERVVGSLGLDRAVESGQLALALVDLTVPSAPRLAMLNGHAMMYAASLPKIAILLGAFVEAQRGRLPLDGPHLSAIHGMIRYSSNTDATRVLNWVGRDRLLEIVQSPGIALYDAKRSGGLWVGKSYGAEAAYRRDPVAHLSHGATAFQVARFYYLLVTDRLVSPALTPLMKAALGRPALHHKFVKGLERYAGIEIFRKSGTWKDTHADSALVESGGRALVMVGLARHADGGEWLARLAGPMHDLIGPARPGAVASSGAGFLLPR
jgi:beta-lactamase class A